MGIGRIFGSFLALNFLFRPLISQQPNTDESFVFEFLEKMGLNPPQDYGFSGAFCSWRGVVCDEKEEHIVKLEASGLGLSGVISDITIGKLVKLETLDLSCNYITALPSDFWSLDSLVNLNLSHNKLTGSFSSNIGNFRRLRTLDFSYNGFSGSMPEAISSLESLKVLNLSHNGFESTVPLGIAQFHSLVSFDLSGNNLGGSLPDGFGKAFPRLEFLNLAGNRIAGRASDLSGMEMITYINVSGNLFGGSVVGVFEGPLEVIDLSRNQFQGHIAQVNFSSDFDWSRLIYLDLSENQLSGEFFARLSLARNLKHLNLAYNRFSKQRFLQVDMLSDLEYVNLSSTQLIGQIPSNISWLSSLKVLDLSCNHLDNRIPPLGTMKLKVLDLSYNNLTGDIPLMLMEELHEMDRFNFSFNNVSFCGSRFSPKTLQGSFIGSVNSCPIAANPDFFEKKPSHRRGLKLALALSLSLICLLMGLLFLAFQCRRKPSRTWAVKQSSYREEQSVSGPFSFQTDSTTWVADVKQATSVPVVIFEKPLLNFTFVDLLSSTSHFDRGTLLAEGRFGPVYGGLLPGGIHVAVKVLIHGSTLTDHEAAREFEHLGRIKHPNLVPLTGYCLAGDQRMAIYEYMENGNLQKMLHDLPLGIQTPEDWSTDTWDDNENHGIQNGGPEGAHTTWRFRHKIALGTARALAFLHHGCSPPIIHRDVKTSSVYLDSNLEPRLSDFGLAKIFGNGLEDEIARGSPGYLAPEFLQPESSSPKTQTPKSDVYGFGIILLELVTGKRPVEDSSPDGKDGSLVSWVRALVRRNQTLEAVDPKIRGTGPDGQMVEALKIGYLCTAENPSKRPSMQQVVGLLKDLQQITV